MNDLSPAPWEARPMTFPNPDDLWEVIDAEGFLVVDAIPKPLAQRIALWRNSEDVMMRRGWYAVKGTPDNPDVWYARGRELLPVDCRARFAADPFTAIVEAEKWYVQHVEKETLDKRAL